MDPFFHVRVPDDVHWHVRLKRVANVYGERKYQLDRLCETVQSQKMYTLKCKVKIPFERIVQILQVIDRVKVLVGIDTVKEMTSHRNNNVKIDDRAV